MAPELVLREVGRDRVDPGRELLARVKPVEMARHPDERLLHEVLRPLAIPDHAVREIQEPSMVAPDDLTEGARVP